MTNPPESNEQAHSSSPPGCAILHITESHEASAGGIPQVVTEMARYSARRGFEVHILSAGRIPLPPPRGVGLTNVPPRTIGRPWGWSPRLGNAVKSLIQSKGAKIVHIHGAWLASQWHGARLAQRNRVPFVLSLHGQLEKYHWNDKGPLQLLKKRLYWTSVAYPAFRGAGVVHAITTQEERSLRELFPGQKIQVIPNAADLEYVDNALAEASSTLPAGRLPVVGFLGRFHAKKGIALLIEGFRQADLPREWTLALAGPDGRPAYMRQVHDLASRTELKGRVRFLGPLYGVKKWQFYASVAVLAVPSFSEVIGMVNLEAAACGTPTITTYQTGLDDWEDGGGLLVQPTAEDIARALSRICSESGEEYERRSVASRRLIEHRYSWSVIGPRWERLYTSLA